jgi:hypothetical protein
MRSEYGSAVKFNLMNSFSTSNTVYHQLYPHCPYCLQDEAPLLDV